MMPLLIGWKERVDFLDWGIMGVRVKMDTGARTSAVDADNVEIVEHSGGARSIRFSVRLRGKRAGQTTVIQVPVLRTTCVRNTGGLAGERCTIETTIRLGPVTKRILLTIADRQRMLSPVILGRRALEGDFIIDPGRKYVVTSL